jgi:hypothetical protein
MGYRTILSSPLLLTIKNTSGNRVVVSGANVAPGQSRTVAGNVFVNDKYRAEELAGLTRLHAIQVLLNGLGYINFVLTADQLTGLAATGVVPQGEVPQLATVNLPANTDVPVGFRAYDTTLIAFVTNDGAAWV